MGHAPGPYVPEGEIRTATRSSLRSSLLDAPLLGNAALLFGKAHAALSQMTPSLSRPIRKCMPFSCERSLLLRYRFDYLPGDVVVEFSHAVSARPVN